MKGEGADGARGVAWRSRGAPGTTGTTRRQGTRSSGVFLADHGAALVFLVGQFVDDAAVGLETLDRLFDTLMIDAFRFLFHIRSPLATRRPRMAWVSGRAREYLKRAETDPVAGRSEEHHSENVPINAKKS